MRWIFSFVWIFVFLGLVKIANSELIDSCSGFAAVSSNTDIASVSCSSNLELDWDTDVAAVSYVTQASKRRSRSIARGASCDANWTGGFPGSIFTGGTMDWFYLFPGLVNTPHNVFLVDESQDASVSFAPGAIAFVYKWLGGNNWISVDAVSAVQLQAGYDPIAAGASVVFRFEFIPDAVTCTQGPSGGCDCAIDLEVRE